MLGEHPWPAHCEVSVSRGGKVGSGVSARNDFAGSSAGLREVDFTLQSLERLKKTPVFPKWLTLYFSFIKKAIKAHYRQLGAQIKGKNPPITYYTVT